MSHNYDNWERLVRAVLLREELREIALSHSREPSTITDESSSSFDHTRESSFSFSDHHQPLLERRTGSRLPADYSDLMTNHTDWKALLPWGKDNVVWSSASLSFSLDKKTGKNCFMVGARGLLLPQNYHKLVSYSQSRFSEVAEFRYNLRQMHIQGRIEIKRLSQDTLYRAYLVFKLEILSNTTSDEPDDFFLDDSHKKLHLLNLYQCMLESAVGTIRILEDGITDVANKRVFKQIMRTRELSVYDRGDGWKEVEIGSIYVDGKKSGEVEAQLHSESFLETHLKEVLIVEGIEFRPYMHQRAQLFGSFSLQPRMKRKKTIVIKVEVHNKKETKKTMKAVSAVAGVEYIHMNMKEMRLTVVGDVESVQVLSKLRKSWHAKLLADGTDYTQS